jgi:hypothetical protein
MRTEDVESLPSRATDGVSLAILPRIRGALALIDGSWQRLAFLGG